MASAWGKSWGKAWGSSWGVIGVVVPAYSQEIDISLDKPKSRPKQQSEQIAELAEQLQQLQAKKDKLQEEKKHVTRSKKKAKIRSGEFYELQTYEHLLVLEITQLEASMRDIEVQRNALLAIIERLAWQERLAKEQAMLNAVNMAELDMVFVMTMLMEA